MKKKNENQKNNSLPSPSSPLFHPRRFDSLQSLGLSAVLRSNSGSILSALFRRDSALASAGRKNLGASCTSQRGSTAQHSRMYSLLVITSSW